MNLKKNLITYNLVIMKTKRALAIELFRINYFSKMTLNSFHIFLLSLYYLNKNEFFVYYLLKLFFFYFK